jgi:hypothetical protein
MRSFRCACGNELFFDSTRCVKCGTDVGICGGCQAVVAPIKQAGGVQICPNPSCGNILVRCRNFRPAGCNQYVYDGNSNHGELCECCRLTTILPDLTIAGNTEKWIELEAAKRRVLFLVKHLGFPIYSEPGTLPLSFEFKADTSLPAPTGHASGVITINIREADPIEREKARVQFGEPKRTLVGHIRHELGHYFWERLVKNQGIDAFRDLFGDERQPDYSIALQNYYSNGPKATWAGGYVSAYASMHPWEDFAETFSAYLDMQSVLFTARYFGVVQPTSPNFDSMLKAYQRIGIIANELNRDMGLLDLVPVVFTSTVSSKLVFVDSLRSTLVMQAN